VTPVAKDQQERFLREILPSAAKVCPVYGLDPKRCVMEAAVASSCGRFTIGWNWWCIPGGGDAGWYTLVVPVRDYGSQSGWRAQEMQVAKFSSPAAAVDAWCRSNAR
jgi:hypothetical protein